MSEWQPIDTAPEGEVVLIYPQMRTAYYNCGDEAWVLGSIPLNEDKTIADDWSIRPRMFYIMYAETYGDDPTHWMPLPPAP